MRVTMFCRFNSEFGSAVFKLIFGGTLLLRLIGWKSVFAGFLSGLLAVPITQVLSGHYSRIMFGMFSYQDERSNTLLEITGSMRQIKFCGLEQHFGKILLTSRAEELSKLRKLFWIISWMIVSMRLGPFLFSVVSLCIYAFTNQGPIKPSVVFPAIGLFSRVYETFEFLPIAFTFVVEAYSACSRLEKFFSRADKDDSVTPGDSIVLRGVTARWPKEETEKPAEPSSEESSEQPAEAITEDRGVLKNVDLEFPTGQLSVITGKTGCGKSLLLATLLDEVKLVSGSIQLPRCPSPYKVEGEVIEIPENDWIIPAASAFVSQSPWIEEGTLRNNILFGLPFNEERYTSVVKACALEKDIELLVKGENTQVGPKGVTLSGGQRWRIALARALYSRAGILILDDVLSAVDTHVGKWLVDHALTGKLAHGRTRILATHHDNLLKGKSAYHVHMKDCEIDYAETTAVQDASSSSSEEELDESVAEAVQAEARPAAAGAEVEDDTLDENSAAGRVPFHVYWSYFKATDGWKRWTPALLLALIMPSLNAARTWALKDWTGHLVTEPGNSTASFAPVGQTYVAQMIVIEPATAVMADPRETAYYLGIYAGLYLLVTILNGVAAMYWWTIGLRGSKVLFERMTKAVLGAPLRWIDMTPSGRIVNRFTTDFVTLDRSFVVMFRTIFEEGFYILVVLGAR